MKTLRITLTNEEGGQIYRVEKQFPWFMLEKLLPKAQDAWLGQTVRDLTWLLDGRDIQSAKMPQKEGP